MKKNILFGIAISGSLMLVSCGGGEKHDDHATAQDSVAAAVDSSSTPVNELAEFKFHTLLANIPSPLEFVQKFPECGISLNKDLLNKAENDKKYSTVSKKALNYGVYGVDLGYLTSYQQNQDIIKYFTSARKLAESLGAGAQFDAVASKRFESNLNNKDSMMVIMDEAYSATEEYLKSNERLEAASLMLAGSWVESQYILVESIKGIEKNDKNAVLFDRLTENCRHLESLLGLLKEYTAKNADIKSLEADLQKLKSAYDPIKGGNPTAEQISKISESLSSVRTKIIS